MKEEDTNISHGLKEVSSTEEWNRMTEQLWVSVGFVTIKLKGVSTVWFLSLDL